MLDQLPDWKALNLEQKIAQVTPMAAEGMSSGQIAARFRNTTRNTIIGICSRYGMKLGANRPKPPAKPKKPVTPRGQKGQPKVNAIVASVAARARIAPPAFEPEPFDAETDVGIDVTKRIGLMGLNERTCKWPVGPDTGAQQMFCGCRKGRDDGPYCPTHTARAEYRR